MNILIIDDSSYKTDWIKKELNSFFEVSNNYTCFEDACSALCDLRENTYDLIILDMQFPWGKMERIERETGLDVLSELDRLELTIPVIVCSSELFDFSKVDYDHYIGFVKYDSSVAYSKFPQILTEHKVKINKGVSV